MADHKADDNDAMDITSTQAQPFISDKEPDMKFPNRPRNHNPSLPFHTLHKDLFDPLLANLKRPKGPAGPLRRRIGPDGPHNKSPQEMKRNIIEKYIARWRKEVGNDIYPAFRLIVPDKDRDRAMYGLKEKLIGKILVKVMKINRNSEDAQLLLNWKLPGLSAQASRVAGDFGGRCFEVLSKRPVRTEVGILTIDEVNGMLDQLASEPREEGQTRIFEEFYRQMNPSELMWLVRIILRQMKIGATERTIFNVWHPDAESLFSVSSSLRRVCWELFDPELRLNSEETGVTLMQCFQPQLANFQLNSFEKIVARMQGTSQDPEFWIEEKLDGERMQLHMVDDGSVEGGKRFGFWSRKAKDYAYLYGTGFMDDSSSLTRYIKEAFDERIDSIILDGEMITWDPVQNAIVPFGTLKTAALEQQKNPHSATSMRPVFKVFDCLLLNGTPLTAYTLRDRRKALSKAVKPIPGRLEIHDYLIATKVDEIEPRLRDVVAKASEGLVIKNPRSAYRLNDRNDDWIKVKPEYMTEFGESLDCIIVGGYFGSGRRGGAVSSFMCGLRVDPSKLRPGDSPMKCFSFFKVGGGFTANDYAAVRHHTEGKWIEWDMHNPPTNFIELGGGRLQYERPDVWIKPEDSVVLEVKAASVHSTDQFRTLETLRFPRFVKVRSDKNWETALSLQEWKDLRANVDAEREDKKSKEFEFYNERRKRPKRDANRPITLAGGGRSQTAQDSYKGPHTGVFDGHEFYILSESLKPERKSKAELEQMVKANGGILKQTAEVDSDVICVADKRVVAAASLIKRGVKYIVRPAWLFDSVRQGKADLGKSRYMLPFEPEHMLYASDEFGEDISGNVDAEGDSYARDTDREGLKQLFRAMQVETRRNGRGDGSTANGNYRSSDDDANGESDAESAPRLMQLLHNDDDDYNGGSELPVGWLFRGLTMYFEDLVGGKGLAKERAQLESNIARFGGAKVATTLNDREVTHVIVSDVSAAKRVRAELAKERDGRIPRLVLVNWIEESWKEKTRLAEERFTP